MRVDMGYHDFVPRLGDIVWAKQYRLPHPRYGTIIHTRGHRLLASTRDGKTGGKRSV